MRDDLLDNEIGRGFFLAFQLNLTFAGRSRREVPFLKARNLWWYFGGINFAVESVPGSRWKLTFILLEGSCGA